MSKESYESNLTPEYREPSEHDLFAQHATLGAEMKALLEEERGLVESGVTAEADLDRLKVIHDRQDAILSQQRHIEQELGNRMARE